MSISRSGTIDLESIRRPVSAGEPAGRDLVFDSEDRVHRQIRSARPSDDEPAIAEDQDPLFRREAAPPTDWSGIARLGLDALATRTKDFQIAAWVVEALGQLRGHAGLRDGFELMICLQQEFWDLGHPAIEDGDLEYRAAPYLFLGEQLPRIIRTEIPIGRGGERGFEATVSGYEKARSEGAGDAWLLMASRTDAPTLAQLATDLSACHAAFESWRTDTQGKLGAHGPTLDGIASALAAFDAMLAAIPRPKAVEPRPQTHAQPAAAPAAGREPAPAAPAPEAVVSDDPSVRAEELEKRGEIHAAIELLDTARQSAKSRRERFLRQLQLAEICIRARRVRVAMHLLEELEAEATARKLDEWEDASVCGRIYDALILGLRDRKDDDGDERIKGYYLQLSRLDPRRALRHDF